MTAIQIELPDLIAEQARKAGLLAPDTLERLIREELRKQAGEHLLAAMKRMDEDDTPAMSPEEICEEVRAVRRAKQTR